MKSRALQESFLKEMRPKLSLEKRVRITFVKKGGEVKHEPPRAETGEIKRWCLLGDKAVVFIGSAEICHK